MSDSFELLPSPVDDPRWPCVGQHKEGPIRSNQHARCPRCGLRVRYWSRGKAKGSRRSAGPSREVLATASRMEMEASQVTEKMVNDKCMEITGRMRQEGRAVVLSEKMVKNTTDQTPAPSSGQRPTTMSTAVASQRLAPTCTERRNQGHLDNEALGPSVYYYGKAQPTGWPLGLRSSGLRPANFGSAHVLRRQWLSPMVWQCAECR